MLNEKMAEAFHFSGMPDERLVLNVGGKRYETFKGTLTSIPDTRLAWVAEAPHETAPEYDSKKKEFFFDRHSAVFEEILNYYRTGKLHCPRNVCSAVVEEEFSFWGIDEEQMEACCWPEYNRQRAAIKILRDFNTGENATDSPDPNTAKEVKAKRFSRRVRISRCKDHLRKKKENVFVCSYKKYRGMVWRMLEEPYSSISAKVIAIISMAFIIISVLDFSLATIPIIPLMFSFNVIEHVCGAWFTLEILLRFAFCPSIKALLKRPLTWVDIGALLPFYLNFVLSMYKMEFGALIVLRLLRVFRLFRFSGRLQVMALALKGSLHELGLLLLIMVISVFFFSTLVHYTEYREGSGNKSFQNIPASFWWTVVTLTTVGYGDVTPETWPGKVIGGLCAIWGVLMIALPISIVNSNFSLYYSHGQALMRLPKKATRYPFSPSIKRYLDYYNTISQLSLNCRYERERSSSGKAKMHPPTSEHEFLHSTTQAIRSRSLANGVPMHTRRCPNNAGDYSSSIDTVNLSLMPSNWAIKVDESSDNELEERHDGPPSEAVFPRESHTSECNGQYHVYV